MIPIILSVTKSYFKGNVEETITALNEYVKEFMGDQEAWMELCELYIRQQVSYLSMEPFYMGQVRCVQHYSGNKSYRLSLNLVIENVSFH